ncbi:MAG: hypothetical protein COA65_03695 [Rhodospirillaceae bacterium]|nr:MAG: hypothetical protein COA65_03695 [Rhodospirillaceae bacterium]
MTAFKAATRAEIDAALADPDPANPIAVEVARLIETYTANFEAHCNRLGHVPTEILLAKPPSEIELVAMKLTNQAISDSLGWPLKVIWT